MKIGAQLFSVRDQAKTPEDIRKAFEKCRDMGYEVVHSSGLGPIDPYELRDISQEFGLPITITHTSPKRLEEDLDAVIAEHKIYGCPVVGIGSYPKSLRDGSFETWKGWYAKYLDISKRIEDAGLKFAYHNHNFEFDKLDNGTTIYDFLIEENENWELIADICWIQYAGADLLKTLRRIKGRIRNAHLKDIKDFVNKDFCPLGQGIVTVEEALPVLVECGCEFAHVEQDNATTLPDPFGQMRDSADYLKKIGWLK